MNRVNIWLLILGMAVVTYILRALPAVLIEKMHFSPKVEKFLKLIPYTVMAALIFPGVLSADAARPEIGVIGGVTPAVLAWKRCPVMVCVLAAIGAVFLVYMYR